jgi:nucleotide-binding universal stress UspA family protein
MMNLKIILASLNGLDRLTRLLESSTRLAVQYDAHVIGLYVIPGPTMYPGTGPYAAPQVFDATSRYFEESLPGVKERFEAAMKRNGLASNWLEVRAVSSAMSGTVSDVGRIADLIIIDAGGSGVEAGFAADVVLGAGRPVLVLPRDQKGDLDLSQIICGYNGSREAARAIHDALPVLKRASDVRLVWVDPSKDAEAAGPMPAADMAECLARHGIKATAESMPTTGINPAAALMTRARDLNAGLIVMGAYGHSRLREFVLGGATKHALAATTVPLMMSH